MRVMLADTGDSWWCVIIAGVFGAADPIWYVWDAPDNRLGDAAWWPPPPAPMCNCESWPLPPFNCPIWKRSEKTAWIPTRDRISHRTRVINTTNVRRRRVQTEIGHPFYDVLSTRPFNPFFLGRRKSRRRYYRYCYCCCVHRNTCEERSIRVDRNNAR